MILFPVDFYCRTSCKACRNDIIYAELEARLVPFSCSIACFKRSLSEPILRDNERNVVCTGMYKETYDNYHSVVGTETKFQENSGTC